MGYIEAAELIIAAASTAYSATASSNAAEAQQAQYRAELTSQRLASVDRQRKGADRLEQVLGQQAATEAARGVSLASPSFKTVQRKSYESFDEDTHAEALNVSFDEESANAKIDASRSKNTAAQFDAVSSLATSAFDQYNVNSSSNTINSDE